MAHYKIKNITTKLGKRHINVNTNVKVEYFVGFQKKYRSLRPNEEIIMTCRTLPISIHNLRIKNLVTVTEISENEFLRLQKPSAKKSTSIKDIKKIKEDSKNEKNDSKNEKDDEKESTINKEDSKNEKDDEKESTSSTSRKKAPSKKKTSSSSTIIVKEE